MRSSTALNSRVLSSLRFRAEFFAIASQSLPISRCIPSAGGEPLAAACARASDDSSDSRVVSCQATTRKPAASSFARVASADSRKLMLGFRA